MWDLPTIIKKNARSLNAEKVDELQVIVDDYDIAVACITETWFREYMDNTSLALEGFCLERKDRVTWGMTAPGGKTVPPSA